MKRILTASAVLLSALALSLAFAPAASADHDNYNWQSHATDGHFEEDAFSNSMELGLTDGIWFPFQGTYWYCVQQASIRNDRPDAHTARLQIIRRDTGSLMWERVTPAIQPGDTYYWTDMDHDLFPATREMFLRAKWGDSSTWREADFFYNAGNDTNTWGFNPEC